MFEFAPKNKPGDVEEKYASFNNDNTPRIRLLNNFLSDSNFNNFRQQVESLEYVNNPYSKRAKAFVYSNLGIVNTPVDRSAVPAEHETTVKFSSGRYFFKLSVDQDNRPKIDSTKFCNYYGRCKISEGILIAINSLQDYLVSYFQLNHINNPAQVICFGVEIQKHILTEEAVKNCPEDAISGLNWHTDIAHCHENPTERRTNRRYSQLSLVYYSKIQNIKGGELEIRLRGDEKSVSSHKIQPKQNTALLFTNKWFEHKVHTIELENPDKIGLRETIVFSFMCMPTEKLPPSLLSNVDFIVVDNSSSPSNKSALHLSTSHSSATPIVTKIIFIMLVLEATKYEKEAFIMQSKNEQNNNTENTLPMLNKQKDSDGFANIAHTIWLYMIGTSDFDLLTLYDKNNIARAIVRKKCGFWSEDDLTKQQIELVEPVKDQLFNVKSPKC